MDCFTLELNSIATQVTDLSHAVTLRIFYLKTIMDHSQARHFICECLERMGTLVPFTLVPVEGLGDGAIMLFSCWFQRKTICRIQN